MARLPGFAPIEPLLDDPEVTEIMINGHQTVFVESRGQMRQVPTPFTGAHQLTVLIEAMIGPTGRAVNAKSPMADFRLADGSRVNVVIPPVALDGPCVTIRKFTKTISTVDDLVRRGMLSDKMAYLLYAAITAKLNVLFSGGAGTGKTTLLGLLSAYIPDSERLVVIEDTAELEFKQSHVVRLECRPPNIEGAGAIKQAELLRNSLRMRPTRIIVGEVRGDEAIEMLQAMTSGHDGCLAVLHASSPAHAVSRLEMMILSRGLHLPLWGIQRQIASSIDLIVQVAQPADGVRRVTHITEVRSVADDAVQLRDLYRWHVSGYDAHGRPEGAFQSTGESPDFLDRFRHLDADTVAKLFEPPNS